MKIQQKHAAKGRRPTPVPYPFMSSFDEAEAQFACTKDPFYLIAFTVQCWLGGLALEAAAEYAEKKNPRDRAPQSGQAWRTFLDSFPSAAKQDRPYLLSCLRRFCDDDPSPGNSLRRALIPLAIEHQWLTDLPSSTANEPVKSWFKFVTSRSAPFPSAERLDGLVGQKGIEPT